MNKIELAKMLGLKSNRPINVSMYDIKNLINYEWEVIVEDFCGGVIRVEIVQDDLYILDISLEDLITDVDIEVCIVQVESLIWERAAEKYLERVHKTTMLIGGGYS